MPEIVTDAELINEYAKKATEESQIIETEVPFDSEVALPGGLLEPNGEIIRTAEVREMTGADEEAIARASTAAKALNVILQRGLVSLGSRKATGDDLDTLLSGDRDAILIGIRRATFGDELHLNTACFSCNAEQEVVIDVVKDIPVRGLDDPANDRVWDIETRKGTVTVALPTGLVQKKLIDAADKTSAEISTVLLSGCILSVNNRPSMGTSTALSLSMADRSKVVEQIIRKNPGPRLGEVKKACGACGEDILLPLSLMDLFRP